MKNLYAGLCTSWPRVTSMVMFFAMCLLAPLRDGLKLQSEEPARDMTIGLEGAEYLVIAKTKTTPSFYISRGLLCPLLHLLPTGIGHKGSVPMRLTQAFTG